MACGDGTSEPERPLGPSIWSYNPVWSEANDLIAFVHLNAPGRDHPDSSGIYTIKPDGTDRRILYPNELSWTTFGLDWSPDGQWLIASIGQDIVKISYPDGEADTLTDEGDLFSPAWSPDGQYIAYESHVRDSSGIYIMQTDGYNKRYILQHGWHVDWPYSDSIIYENSDHQYHVPSICISDTTGNNIRELYIPPDSYNLRDIEPKMHAETGRIVFHAQNETIYTSMWFLEPNESVARKIKDYAMFPSFSPNGDQIVYVNVEKGNGNIYIINWDGTGLRQLTF